MRGGSFYTSFVILHSAEAIIFLNIVIRFLKMETINFKKTQTATFPSYEIMWVAISSLVLYLKKQISSKNHFVDCLNTTLFSHNSLTNNESSSFTFLVGKYMKDEARAKGDLCI